ncbi:hypothetical protein VST7929_01444 [Vibrio stylophorae]|uniref:Tim44-like domain-containing protein n=1 Tax=Vibrio stylophorae TaxID=659351 RepID=A0ABM8ZTC7_9VIBR|nr:TIM44-like domain-containing protein [Vibrio stylophorae]CAH0533574.1 hypothetical protein VST7929_01444 [Vibrio stylophorae]
MKRIFSLVALLMVAIAITPIAEAKRFGGSKSFGKSFKTAPAPKHQRQDTRTVGQDQKAKPSSNKKGLMGGLLGGLLAGGLLAALFAGGAFNGIQFMDVLIIAGVAFIIFKLIRGMLAAKQGSMNQHQYRQQPAFGGNQYQPEPNVHQFEQPQQTVSGGGFGAPVDVPHNYPAGFDQAAFINGAREHYRILQGAWNHNELDKIAEYVSPSLFEDLKAERAALVGEQHTDVLYIDAEIVRADYDSNSAELSLQFKGRYRDAVEGIEEDIEDVWHLERDLTTPNAPWLIVGIQNS